MSTKHRTGFEREGGREANSRVSWENAMIEYQARQVYSEHIGSCSVESKSQEAGQAEQ